jgi:hypothetical protein
MKNTNLLAYWGAGLSGVAVVEHTFNLQEHLHEWWGYGAFFILAASFQLYYGIVLFLRPWRYDETGAMQETMDVKGRAFYIFGIVLNAIVIIFYIFSRTTGMAFLSAQAVRDPVTPLNLLSVAVNIPIIICLVLLLRQAVATTATAPPAGTQEDIQNSGERADQD